MNSSLPSSWRNPLIFALAITTALAVTGCSQQRGIKCTTCGEIAIYTPGGPNLGGGLLYVCPNGHNNFSSRLIR